MRIIFIGQAAFGKESLHLLIEQKEEIVGVITIPEKPNQNYPNPVKELAEKNGLPLYQSKLLKTPEAVSWVKSLQPDLLVLAFVTSFVPKEMIDVARLGGINYHPSLLPKYRGGSAINWAIIEGETETGVTIHFIDEGVDTGPILLQEKVSIDPDDTVKSVYFDKLYPLGIRMISSAVKLIREGKAVPTLQDEGTASFQPVITADDTMINWSQPTDKVYNLIRGANPAPGAVTSFGGESCKIFDAKLGTGKGSAGTILTVDQASFTVATGDGAIVVQSIQQPKSKKQPARDFITHNNIQEGDRLGS
jgi:methionyl-tRNA formyltransferase